MSATTADTPGNRWSRLPRWAQPRPEAHGDPAGRDLRGIETALLIILGLVLAVAVVHDVVLQVRLNTRESADRTTWRAYEHRYVKVLDVRTLEHGTIDFVCLPSLTKTAAEREIRPCLMISGPIVNGHRTVDGGYFIPPKRADRYQYRYGCFGLPAQRQLCGLRSPPALT